MITNVERHEIAEILLKLALNNNQPINQLMPKYINNIYLNSGAPGYKIYIHCLCMNKMYFNGFKECVVTRGLPSISDFSADIFNFILAISLIGGGINRNAAAIDTSI